MEFGPIRTGPAEQLHLILGLGTILIVAALVPVAIRRMQRAPTRSGSARWRLTAIAWALFCLTCAVVLTQILLGQLRAALYVTQGLGLLGAFLMVFYTWVFSRAEDIHRRQRRELESHRRALEEHRHNLEMLVRQRTEVLRQEIEERRSIQKSLTERQQQQDRELQLAGELQRTMLTGVPDCAFARFAVRFQPHSRVSGDTYAIEAGAQHCRILLADAMGHGVAAALLTQVVQTGLQRFPLDESGPDVLAGLNRLLAGSGQMAYATACHLLLDAWGHLHVTAAGNPPILLRRAAIGTLEEISGQGSPIGMFEELPEPYQSSYLRLQPGDRLFLYTDGILEWRNQGGEMFGVERIRRAIEHQRISPLDEAIDGILKAGRFFAGGVNCGDDLCLIAVEYRPDPAEDL